MKALAAAKLQVMREVPYIRKTQKQGLQYKTVSIEEVLDALKPAMDKAELCLCGPFAITPVHCGTIKTKAGADWPHIVSVFEFRLVHGPSGESHPVCVLGEAVDGQDKGSNKSMTAAQKYAHLLAFDVATGTDDPDNHQYGGEEEEPPPRQQAAQQAPSSNGTPSLSPDVYARTSAARDKLIAMVNQQRIGSICQFGDVVTSCKDALAPILIDTKLVAKESQPVFEQFFIKRLSLIQNEEEVKDIVTMLEHDAVRGRLAIGLHSRMLDSANKMLADIQRKTAELKR